MDTHNTNGTKAELKAVKETMDILRKTFETHAYGMIQCLFCVHGVATESKSKNIDSPYDEQNLTEIFMLLTGDMIEHMVIHPSEPRYCCIRQPPLKSKVSQKKVSI